MNNRFCFSNHSILSVWVAMALSACAVGPNFKHPQSTAPDSWTSWRSGDARLHTLPTMDTTISDNQWWKRYQDDDLNFLVEKALSASPDIHTAALRFASARIQRKITGTQQTPDLNFNAEVSRIQQSEHSPSTRALKEIAPNPDELTRLIALPSNWYQSGVNFSWEIDLWGHVRRAIEAADADTKTQQAMLQLAKLSIVSDVVNNYYNLRCIQQQIVLAKQDEQALYERLLLIKAQTKGGALDESNLDRQRSELATIRATLIDLQMQEGIAINQLLVLLGEHPGALRQQLQYHPNSLKPNQLPPLQLGIPSEVALNRPDIQAAEAKLHAATARIGVAQAELYPSITLGGRIGIDAYSGHDITEWRSRSWSVGPSLSLPLFDRGRRKDTVVLRKLDQQQAAVDYHNTVLKAWQEIDDALSRYTASQQKLKEQTTRARSTAQALTLIQARYDGGLNNFIDVLDAQRSNIQARQSLASSQRDVMNAWSAVNRAVGNYPRE